MDSVNKEAQLWRRSLRINARFKNDLCLSVMRELHHHCGLLISEGVMVYDLVLESVSGYAANTSHLSHIRFMFNLGTKQSLFVCLCRTLKPVNVPANSHN